MVMCRRVALHSSMPPPCGAPVSSPVRRALSRETCHVSHCAARHDALRRGVSPYGLHANGVHNPGLERGLLVHPESPAALRHTPSHGASSSVPPSPHHTPETDTRGVAGAPATRARPVAGACLPTALATSCLQRAPEVPHDDTRMLTERPEDAGAAGARSVRPSAFSPCREGRS